MKYQALLLWTSIVVPASAASVAWNSDSVQIVLTSSGTVYDLQLEASRRDRRRQYPRVMHYVELCPCINMGTYI